MNISRADFNYYVLIYLPNVKVPFQKGEVIFSKRLFIWTSSKRLCVFLNDLEVYRFSIFEQFKQALLASTKISNPPMENNIVLQIPNTAVLLLDR